MLTYACILIDYIICIMLIIEYTFQLSKNLNAKIGSNAVGDFKKKTLNNLLTIAFPCYILSKLFGEPACHMLMTLLIY